jgi:hypothetical protein
MSINYPECRLFAVQRQTTLELVVYLQVGSSEGTLVCVALGLSWVFVFHTTYFITLDSDDLIIVRRKYTYSVTVACSIILLLTNYPLRRRLQLS